LFKKTTWFFLFVIAVAGLIVLSHRFNTAPEVSQNSILVSYNYSDTISGLMKVVIIGDSIAKGTGDENGSGFSTYLPGYFKEYLLKEVKIDNLGIDELRSTGLLERLKNGEYASQVAECDLVVMSIGGNDILSLQYVTDITKYGILYDTLKEIHDNYLINLKEALRTIRESNERAPIAFIGLYNPREDLASYANTLLLNMWNNSTKQILEEDGRAIFIPTQDIFKSDLKRYISSDTLHPSSTGYQAISERIAESLKTIFEK